jgi:hypothetical protein
MPSAVVRSGAQKMNRGAPIIDKSKSRMPGPVPPRVRTIMDKMNVTISIGAAMIQAANPRTGITETPHVTKRSIQAALAGAV